MNFQRYLVPIGTVGLTAWAWQSWGWMGIAMVVTGGVMWLLLYKRMPFKMVPVSPGSKNEGGSRSPAYLAKNPGGTIPTLEEPDTGFVLGTTEAAADISYPDMVIIADGTPVIVECPQSQGYKITAAQLEAAITPKTRLLVLNSPSNPTGMVYSKAELLALADVLRKHPQVLVATDDMYEHIIWTAEKYENIVTVAPDLYDRTIVLNGVSKAYAMTGWRIGYAGGPKPLIDLMRKVAGQTTSNPSSVSQWAAVEALFAEQIVDQSEMLRERAERRREAGHE